MAATMQAHGSRMPGPAVTASQPGLRIHPEAEEVEDQEGRIEKWIVSTLDKDAPAREDNALTLLLSNEPLRKKEPARPAAATALATPPANPWSRIHVIRRREVTVARLVDTSLVREDILAELDDELTVLLDAGARRVVLDFARVERLSSHLIVTLAKAYRRCTETAGGLLRICRLRSEVAEILTIAGLVPQIQNFPDEKSAIDAPWPGAAVILPLPISILGALNSAPEGGRSRPSSRTIGRGPAKKGGPSAQAGMRLIVEGGPSAGLEIPIGTRRFTIGRDPGCHLRMKSASVSRLHATIERRGEGAVLRDLGSTNGTLLNGREVRDAEVRLSHGDSIQVGSSRFLVALGGEPGVEDRIVDWLVDEEDRFQDDGQTMDLSTHIDPNSRPAMGKSTALDLGLPADQLRCEVIEDVLILTPTAGHLDDEETIAPLREALLKIMDSRLPSRLVLNLAYVGHLSSLAIGVLVAHHLRLQRAGGAMRFCLAQPLVLSYLTLIRLPMLVECYPALDDAVLASW